MNFKELTEPLLSNYFLHSESQDSITVNQSNTFNLPFDYEIDSYINNLTEKIKSIDSLPDKLVPKQYKCEPISCWDRKYIKSIVSKKKIRFQKKGFDLDLSYITEKVIAMGFPSSGCESIYRNSLSDVKRFLYNEHGTYFKVYNLCMEANRIYNKNIFSGAKVALFPFQDHQACPVKLMLEFCIDVSLFLLKNEKNVIVVHCKAGKGRTGIMICAYLLFSEIASNSTHAFSLYGERRSHSLKGITVSSQKRYVHHFETYLNCNFERPYYKLIPKIIDSYLTVPKGNLLQIIFNDEKCYYSYKNCFSIKKVKIGPMEKKIVLNCQILNFLSQEIFNTENKNEKNKFKTMILEENEYLTGNKIYFYKIEILDEINIDSDVNLKIIGGNINCNAWLNLFYLTLENFIYLVNTQFKDNIMKKQENIMNGGRLVKNRSKHFSNFSNYSLYSKDSNNGFSYIEMNDLANIDMGISTINEINEEKKSNYEINTSFKKNEPKEKMFIRSYDANFFWKNNINLDGKKIQNFLRNHTKYLGDHINTYDLNNIYQYMNKENPNLFNSKKKKFKIKFDNLGLDNFKNKKLMLPNFSIEITYYLK